MLISGLSRLGQDPAEPRTIRMASRVYTGRGCPSSLHLHSTCQPVLVMEFHGGGKMGLSYQVVTFDKLFFIQPLQWT
jgi:hypothetical protein